MPDLDDVKDESSASSVTQESQPAGVVADPPSASESEATQTPAATEGTEGAEAKVIADVKPQTMLEAVKAAVKTNDDEKIAKVAAAVTKPEVEGEESSPKGELKESDFANEPFAKHPRFKSLLSERNKFHKRLEALEPEAREYGQYKRFIQQDLGMNEDEFTGMLQLGWMSKNDPQALHAVLSKFMGELDVMVGNTLPPDLAARLEAGELDELSAKEIAKERGKANIATQSSQRMAETVEQSQQRQANERATALGNEVKTSVNVLEAEWKKNDPDYSRKAGVVKDRVVMKLRQTPPTTVAEAVALAKAAKAEIDKELGFVQRKQTPKPVNGGKITPTLPVAKTMRDAINIGLQRSRRA